jgi:putative ABC transport system permease protein
MPRLQALLKDEHVQNLVTVPMIRGRVTRLNGVEPDIDELDPDGRWIMRGDRGFTFAAEPSGDTHIVEGKWWPADYAGPPLVSMEAEAGHALGLKVGDAITINVLGRSMEAKIANFRKVDWSTMAINFALVFSPNTLAGAPYQYLATVRVPPEREAALATAMGAAFPNITIIRISAVLAEVSALLAKVLAVISAAAGVTILCGLMVVAGATAAGFRQRLKETAILRAIGATSGDIRWAFLAEFLLLGAAVAVLALGAGTLGAWFIVTYWLEGHWAVGWSLALWVLAGVIITSVAFALVSYRTAMRQPVTAVLRIP